MNVEATLFDALIQQMLSGKHERSNEFKQSGVLDLCGMATAHLTRLVGGVSTPRSGIPIHCRLNGLDSEHNRIILHEVRKRTHWIISRTRIADMRNVTTVELQILFLERKFTTPLLEVSTIIDPAGMHKCSAEYAFALDSVHRLLTSFFTPPLVISGAN